jgi:hypothetical protein
MNEGRCAALLHSSGGNDEPAVFDGDLDALTGLEAGVLDPSAGELHPRIKRRRGALMRGFVPRRLKASRLLNGDEPF